MDPAVYDALARWAADELRSTNAQIELILRRALLEANRSPAKAGPMPRRGRPSKADLEPADRDRESAASQGTGSLPE